MSRNNISRESEMEQKLWKFQTIKRKREEQWVQGTRELEKNWKERKKKSNHNHHRRSRDGYVN